MYNSCKDEFCKFESFMLLLESRVYGLTVRGRECASAKFASLRLQATGNKEFIRQYMRGYHGRYKAIGQCADSQDIE